MNMRSRGVSTQEACARSVAHHRKAVAIERTPIADKLTIIGWEPSNTVFFSQIPPRRQKKFRITEPVNGVIFDELFNFV